MGKRALITGGDSGIGRAVAIAFARGTRERDFTKLTAEQIERTFRTNIFATMWMAQAALAHLEAAR